MPLVVKNYKLHAPSTKFRMTVMRVKIMSQEQHLNVN